MRAESKPNKIPRFCILQTPQLYHSEVDEPRRHGTGWEWLGSAKAHTAAQVSSSLCVPVTALGTRSGARQR